ncbi:MAG: hypothetical protein V1753_09220 [Pseudomonadota bacterium]
MIPIIIGVTGHRDLRSSDLPELEGKIEKLIKHIVESLCPNSPIKIISPLADGADRLVAKVGIRMGCGFICALPLPLNEYKKDFVTEESLNEFQELLHKAEYCFELPLVEGNTADNISNYGENRNRQYAAVGAYIAAHSQILIAIWNGKDTKETGGTSEIVRFRLNGIPQPYAKPLKALDVPETGSVYHIFSARARKDADVTINNHTPEAGEYVIDKQPEWDVLYPRVWKSKQSPTEDARNNYAQLLRRIDEFNKEIRDNINNQAFINEVTKNKGYVYSDTKQSSLNDGMKGVLESYSYADTLSQRHQKPIFKALKILPAATVLGFFFFSFFDEIWSATPVLMLFPVILGVGFYIFQNMQSKDMERKYLDYRVLAEGLRVQFFWKLGGIRENIYEHYQRKYKGELDWMAQAIRSISIKANNFIKTPASGAERKAAYSEICERWVEDQWEYFRKNVKRKIDIPQKQEKITKAFFLLALFFVAGIFALKGFILVQQGTLEGFMSLEDIKDIRLYSVLLVLVDLCIAIGAAFQIYVEKMAFSEEVKQYQRMKDLFSRGSRKLREYIEKSQYSDMELLLIDIGKEALVENCDWLMLKRSKPLEMPIG